MSRYFMSYEREYLKRLAKSKITSKESHEQRKAKICKLGSYVQPVV